MTLPPSPYLRLLNVSKAYPSHQVQALHNVSFELNAGTSTALMGPSGCGKSTLLNVLAGIDKPDTGEIWVNGTGLHTLSPPQLAAYRKNNIGVVFQQFNVLDALTVAENIALPLSLQGFSKNDAGVKVKDMLAAVGLENRGSFYPSQLSGGQLQRVAVARALIHTPGLILADEPTGNLDSATGDQVLELLVSLCKTHNTTLVMATHSQQAASALDECLYLNDGQLDPSTTLSMPNLESV